MSSTFAVERIEAERVSIPYLIKRVIARGTEECAEVVQVSLTAKGRTGRGEAHGQLRYHATSDSIIADIERFRPLLQRGCSREQLLTAMPAGPARNAIDCALWDLEAKLTGRTAEEIAGIVAKPVTTVYTISLGPVDEMAALAAAERGRPLLKIKLGRFEDDAARMRAIRKAAPNAKLVADANEGWSLAQLKEIEPLAHDLGVELIEQPLHADRDHDLASFSSRVALCADESCQTRVSLDHAKGRYAYVNIKLDKTGGLTEALALAREAKQRGFGVMVGCMSGTTLAMAPGFLAAQLCTFVDLDSPIYLPPEQRPELRYEGSLMSWAPHRRWGQPQE